jgi:hypothetical protein
MPIIAKNIKVGAEQAPTQPKEEKPLKSFSDLKNVFGKLTNKLSPEIKDEPSKYVKKKDGDLVRHINTKSSYQKDMLDL